MRRWILPQFGLDHLALQNDAQERAPGPGEVALRMSAWSLNFRDALIVKGAYNPRQPLPVVPLSDGVGEVVEVGPGVDRVTVGDRVCPIFAQRWLAGPATKSGLRSALASPLDGVLAERVVLSEEGVVRVPRYLTDAQAATLPCAAVTAWSALQQADVGPGDWVLAEGTGGVSVFALQLAQILGARCVVTSSSHDKLARASDLGAAAGFDYVDEPEWGKAARRHVGGDGVDCVVDVGGAATLTEAVRATRVGGTIALIGILGSPSGPINVVPILMNHIRLQGIVVGSRARFESLCRALEAHPIEPVVDRVFPFEDLVPALQHLESGAHFGKVVLAM